MRLPTPSGLPAPRNGHWSARPTPIRWTLRRLPSYFYCVYGPCQLWVWFKASLPWALGRWPFYYFVAGSALFLLLNLAYLVGDLTARTKTRRDRAFSDRPEGVEEFMVEAAFNVDGRYLGMDRGVVWFENGLMVFTGSATSFVLAASDIASRTSRSNMPSDGILLATNRALAFVRLRPLIGLGSFRFRWRLRRFLRANETAGGPRQWPPMARYGEDEPEAPVFFNTPEAIGAAAARDGVARGTIRP